MRPNDAEWRELQLNLGNPKVILQMKNNKTCVGIPQGYFSRHWLIWENNVQSLSDSPGGAPLYQWRR